MFKFLKRDKTRLYIEHIADDPSDGTAYFGPFRNKLELNKALRGGYADLLKEVGRLRVTPMKDSEARKMWINSAKWWKSQ